MRCLLRCLALFLFLLLQSCPYFTHRLTSQRIDITIRRNCKHGCTYRNPNIISHPIQRSYLQVFYAYTYGTAGWLALQSLPLIVSPTIIITLLSPNVREPTALETYFSRSLGMTLLALGIMVVLLTGSVPLTSRISDSRSISLPLSART
jgi:hypothetical protein